MRREVKETYRRDYQHHKDPSRFLDPERQKWAPHHAADDAAPVWHCPGYHGCRACEGRLEMYQQQCARSCLLSPFSNKDFPKYVGVYVCMYESKLVK